MMLSTRVVELASMIAAMSAVMFAAIAKKSLEDIADNFFANPHGSICIFFMWAVFQRLRSLAML
jgi:hypothetical protein